MWVSALFGMVTKYAEVVLAIRYRERNEKGDWVGGPMYYIKNGLGKSWSWLAVVFSLLGALAAFGIGNMTQVNTIATSINTAIDAFGGNTAANSVVFFGQVVPVSSIVIGAIIALLMREKEAEYVASGGGGMDLSALGEGAGETPLFWRVLEKIMYVVALIMALALTLLILKKFVQLMGNNGITVSTVVMTVVVTTAFGYQTFHL